MTLQPRTIRIALGVGALLLVTAVALAAVVVILIRDAPDDAQPAVTAYADGRTIRVEPFRYCAIDLSECTEKAIVELNVPVGRALQLSLPHEIAEGPWNLFAVRQAADGTLTSEERWYRSGEAAAVTVESRPGAQLNGIEIQQPSAATDEQGQPYFRAVWSIKTA